jgi:predicted O-methyltransferase YrrM
MSKLSKLFKALALIVKNPALLNKVLDDEEVNKTAVIAQYNLPNGLKTIAIDQLLPALNITVDPFCSLDGGSTPLDLALLKGLAASKTECDFFEIGTWRGESVANVASVSKTGTTLSLPDQTMLEMGMDKKYVALHRFFSKDLKNVVHIQANSLTFDYASLNKKFDLLFIDGDHHYESVKKDTANAFSILKNNESIIVWHDYGHSPSDIRWDVFRGILDGTPADKRKYLYRVSNTLCAIYTTQPITAVYADLYIAPTNYFTMTVKKVDL